MKFTERRINGTDLVVMRPLQSNGQQIVWSEKSKKRWIAAFKGADLSRISFDDRLRGRAEMYHCVF